MSIQPLPLRAAVENVQPGAGISKLTVGISVPFPFRNPSQEEQWVFRIRHCWVPPAFSTYSQPNSPSMWALGSWHWGIGCSLSREGTWCLGRCKASALAFSSCFRRGSIFFRQNMLNLNAGARQTRSFSFFSYAALRAFKAFSFCKDLKLKLLMKYFGLPKYIKNVITATHVCPVPPKK